MIRLGLLEEDLDQILNENRILLEALSNKNILILGGTGFVGSWISKAIVYYMNQGGTCALTIGSRNALKSLTTYSDCAIKPKIINVNILNDRIQDLSNFDVIINCATPTTAANGSNDAALLYKTITQGSLNLLNSLDQSRKVLRFVNLSSGAVTMLIHEENNEHSSNCPESHLSTPAGAYSHGKRFSENLVSVASRDGHISGINLRLYAFAGPGIPLDQHFAAGNFMMNAWQGKPIDIKGNPATTRSYQYPTDLVRSILFAATGTSVGTFEVGNSRQVTMLELASEISLLTSKTPVNKGNLAIPISEYSPHGELICDSRIDLEDAITRWWKWMKLSL